MREKSKIKYSKIYFGLLGIIFILFIGVAYYLFATSKGSGFIAKLALSKYVDSKDIDIKSIEGKLSRKLTLKDIEIEDLKWLPRGSVLKIKKLGVYFASFNLKGLNIEVLNGRLRLPDSEIILFYGGYKDGSLDINAFSKYVNVNALLDMFFERQIVKDFSGMVSDVDIYAKGTFLEPTMKGELQIQKLSHKDFLISDCPAYFNLSFKDIKEELKIYGEITFNKGEISGPKTATVILDQSKVLFNGNPKKPSFDLKGTSIVENTKIHITLKGTMDKPELKLSSEPPMSEERLMVMLATNTGWKGAEESASRGQISADLTKDFIDYFVFSGSGSKIAKLLGISDVSLTFEKRKKGIAVKKAVSEKLDASYAIEQTQAEEKEEKGTATQKIGGEYKVTEELSIGAEKELKQDSKLDQTQDEQKTDDRVIFKYKKKF